MTEVKCPYKDECTDIGLLCNSCKHNTGKRSHYESAIPPYIPIDPYPYPPYTPWYPYLIWWTDYDEDTRQYTSHIKLKYKQQP